MFNACNLENTCGRANRFSDYAVFKKTCLAFISKSRLEPKGPSSTDQIGMLAQKSLEMRNFHVLGFNENKQIMPSFNIPLKMTYNGEPIKQFFSEIADQLNTRRQNCGLVHFVCPVMSTEWHGILISVVQNRSGRALYIFDNTNEVITEHSHAKQYIDFLSDFLAISPKKQFKIMQLPTHWPSVPRTSFLNSWLSVWLNGGIASRIHSYCFG